ncbi:hypothetical protein C8R43DRAFT_1241014 [Mycena crocata]|nr:hypothetical protein C8R43DRAFT_1241014 [Mycena crocata]
MLGRSRVQAATRSWFVNRPRFSNSPCRGEPVCRADTGTVRVTAAQLVARPPSVRVAQGTLGVLIIVALAVYILPPRVDLPINPSSMAAQEVLPQHGDFGARRRR